MDRRTAALASELAAQKELHASLIVAHAELQHEKASAEGSVSALKAGLAAMQSAREGANSRVAELEKQLEAEAGFKAALEAELQGTKDSLDLMSKGRQAADAQVQKAAHFELLRWDVEAKVCISVSVRDAQLGPTNVGGILVMSIGMVHWHLQIDAQGSELSAVKDVNTVLETLKEDLLSVLETLKQDLLSQLAMKDEGLVMLVAMLDEPVEVLSDGHSSCNLRSTTAVVVLQMPLKEVVSAPAATLPAAAHSKPGTAAQPRDEAAGSTPVAAPPPPSSTKVSTVCRFKICTFHISVLWQPAHDTIGEESTSARMLSAFSRRSMYDFHAGVNAVGSACCAASTCQDRSRREAHNRCPAAAAAAAEEGRQGTTAATAAAAEEGRQGAAAGTAAAQEGRQGTAAATSPTQEGRQGGSTSTTAAAQDGC